VPRQGLLRIHEAARAVGLTPRAIRFYEQQGLLTPSARSACSYRLFDEDDVQRLRTIKGFRDDAGFSVSEIAGLLADQSATQRDKAIYLASTDVGQRRRIAVEALARLERQLALLDAKRERLTKMRTDIETRADRVRARLAELDAEVRA
jgi:MerR family transcriptional regulator, repressor of the yfmOP operon